MNPYPLETIHETRVLAVHVRPQRFGFAVLKGPQKLLDWGVSTHYVGNDDPLTIIRKRIVPLLRIYAPSALVVRKVTARESERYSQLQPIANAVKEQAERHSIKLAFVGRDEVRHTFGKLGTTTKYEIAARVTKFFPELTWQLPPRRKPWESEHHNMAIFDAVALGFSYFMCFEECQAIFREPSRNLHETA